MANHAEKQPANDSGFSLTEEQRKYISSLNFKNHKPVEVVKGRNGQRYFRHPSDYNDLVRRVITGDEQVIQFIQQYPEKYNSIIKSFLRKRQLVLKAESIIRNKQGEILTLLDPALVGVLKLDTRIFEDKLMRGLFEETFGLKISDDMRSNIDEVVAEDSKDRVKGYLSFSKLDESYELDLLLEMAIKTMYMLKFDQFADPFAWKPLDITSAAYSLPNETNPCWPIMKGRKADDRHAAIDRLVKMLQIENRDGKFPLDSFLLKPAIAFSRRYANINITEEQLEREFKNKVLPKTMAEPGSRVIWGTPHELMIFEAMMVRPLIDRIQRRMTVKNCPMALGISHGNVADVVDNKRLRAQDELGRNKKIVSIDYKRFDSTIPFVFHMLYWSIIDTCCDWSNTEYKRNKYVREGHMDALFIWSLFTPYLFGNNELKFMKRGNVSGQVSTSLFNSFTNITLINSVFHKLYGRVIQEQDMSTLGDDNIFVCHEDITLDIINKEIQKFGMNLNLEKSDVYYNPISDDIKYLGFVWSQKLTPGFSSVPTQTLGWAAGRIIFPETFLRKEVVGERPIWLERTISVFAHLHNGWEYTNRLLKDEPLFNELLSNMFSEIAYIGPNLEKLTYVAPLDLFRQREAWRFI